ncbi:MAG: ZIP family metal transporter [Elusimicrobia bacterium]|nr:ZIP family metal transporter [Elusimicrobiota bacterium]
MSSIFWSSGLAFIVTLLGGTVPFLRKEWARSYLWRFLAFGSGVLLGVAFLHLLPAAFRAGSYAGLGLLVAFLSLFALEGVTMIHACPEFMEECPIHLVGYAALSAMSLHGLLDGLAIAVGFRNTAALGSVISLAVIWHKFSDGLTLSGLLLGTDYTQRKRLLLMQVLALSTPIGALGSYWLTFSLSGGLLSLLLGLVAGMFLYIGAADILPRIHRVRDLGCLIFLLTGVAVVTIFH